MQGDIAANFNSLDTLNFKSKAQFQNVQTNWEGIKRTFWITGGRGVWMQKLEWAALLKLFLYSSDWVLKLHLKNLWILIEIDPRPSVKEAWETYCCPAPLCVSCDCSKLVLYSLGCPEVFDSGSGGWMVSGRAGGWSWSGGQKISVRGWRDLKGQADWMRRSGSHMIEEWGGAHELGHQIQARQNILIKVKSSHSL